MNNSICCPLPIAKAASVVTLPPLPIASYSSASPQKWASPFLRSGYFSRAFATMLHRHLVGENLQRARPSKCNTPSTAPLAFATSCKPYSTAAAPAFTNVFLALNSATRSAQLRSLAVPLVAARPPLPAVASLPSSLARSHPPAPVPPRRRDAPPQSAAQPAARCSKTRRAPPPRDSPPLKCNKPISSTRYSSPSWFRQSPSDN